MQILPSKCTRSPRKVRRVPISLKKLWGELGTVLTSLYFQLWRLHQWTSRSWSGNLSMATRLNLFYQINWICMFKEIIMFILKYAIPICNTKGYEQIAVFGFWNCDFLTADEPFKKYLINSLIHLSVCHKMSQQKQSRDVLFEYHRVVVPFCWAVRPIRSLSTL